MEKIRFNDVLSIYEYEKRRKGLRGRVMQTHENYRIRRGRNCSKTLARNRLAELSPTSLRHGLRTVEEFTVPRRSLHLPQVATAVPLCRVARVHQTVTPAAPASPRQSVQAE
jgi:hypothetical protein